MINNFRFDIIDVIKNMSNSREQILKFSEILLDFAKINIEKEGVKVYEKKISSRAVIIENGKVLTMFRRKKML